MAEDGARVVQLYEPRKGIAESLRELADSIENGLLGGDEVEAGAVVLQTGVGVYVGCYGRASDSYYLLGVLNAGADAVRTSMKEG